MQTPGGPGEICCHTNVALLCSLAYSSRAARRTGRCYALTWAGTFHGVGARLLRANDAHDFSTFNVPACPLCAGVLKPDVVFFGENVPRDFVDAAAEHLKSADGMLVVGSSLMVYSGFRFVQKAQGALNQAKRAHQERAAALEAEREGLDKRSRDEDTQWKRDRERLEKALRQARDM
jgi:NAD-dependent SIR2 family protein deacetylase